MWRYKSLKLEDGTTWQDQSNLLDKNTLQWSAVNNQGFDKSWVVNKDNTCNQTWGINATNNGSDVRTWYYALTFLFHGDYTRGSVEYYYPEDLQYTATITVEIIGL
jgi:Flp pilus assembly protein TadG